MADDTMKTSQHVQVMLTKARSHCTPLHDQIEKWRDLYDFNHYVGRPMPHESRYADPTYTNVVDLAVGILLANGLEFRASGWVPSKMEMEESTRIEKFLMGLIHTNNLRDEVDIVYEAVDRRRFPRHALCQLRPCRRDRGGRCPERSRRPYHHRQDAFSLHAA